MSDKQTTKWLSNKLKSLPRECVEFFVTFSRFEYALKRSGYLRSVKEGAKAEPGWDKCASDLGEAFFTQIYESTQVTELFKRPPRKQVVQNGEIRWKETEQINTVKDLFVAIRKIRNNLFHGGKYPTGPIEEAARNKKLLSGTLWVLEQALEKSPEVNRVFLKYN